MAKALYDAVQHLRSRCVPEGRRALTEFGAFLNALPLLHLTPRGDGHPVLVIPGLMAGDDSTLPLLEGRTACFQIAQSMRTGVVQLGSFSDRP
jgi:hypothetical protein